MRCAYISTTIPPAWRMSCAELTTLSGTAVIILNGLWLVDCLGVYDDLRDCGFDGVQMTLHLLAESLKRWDCVG